MSGRGLRSPPARHRLRRHTTATSSAARTTPPRPGLVERDAAAAAYERTLLLSLLLLPPLLPRLPYLLAPPATCLRRGPSFSRAPRPSRPGAVPLHCSRFAVEKVQCRGASPALGCPGKAFGAARVDSPAAARTSPPASPSRSEAAAGGGMATSEAPPQPPQGELQPQEEEAATPHDRLISLTRGIPAVTPRSPPASIPPMSLSRLSDPLYQRDSDTKPFS
nr:proline-rich protein 36-like [Penaeus vannamei]